MNLYMQYEQLLSDKSWDRILYNTPDFHMEKMFSEFSSSNFIVEYMFYKGYIKVLPWTAINRDRNSFEDRAQHTVSLFLLGLSTIRHMGITIQNVPSYYEDTDDNILYLWSIMCLYHDIGYFFENQKSAITEKCPTVKEFIKYAQIKFNLLDVIDDSFLAEKYYIYILKKFHQVDHGITGGLLMYDRLMKDIHEHEELYSQVIFYFGDKRRFSSSNKECARIMSHSILRHNMWFANVDNYKEYEAAGLEKLILNPEHDYKYRFNDNALLFLLCMLDTIEPVKKEKICTRYDVLKATDIAFDAEGKRLTISVTDGFEVDNYFNKIKDMEKWLDLLIDINKEKGIATIQIL